MNEEDERKLFRAAVRDVRPLRQTKPAPARARRASQAASRRADEARVLADSLAFDAADLGVESGEELSWRRAGVPESVLRRLRRGQYARRDELDLHGMTQAEARLALLSSWLNRPAMGLPVCASSMARAAAPASAARC